MRIQWEAKDCIPARTIAVPNQGETMMIIYRGSDKMLGIISMDDGSEIVEATETAEKLATWLTACNYWPTEFMMLEEVDGDDNAK